MAQLPTHERPLEDDTDEELTDAQVRELLEDASRRMREKKASSQPTSSTATFKLPKLQAGHIADTYSKTQGKITRLDSSKLVNKRDQVLANGVKKIEDPVAIKRQKLEVSAFVRALHTLLAVDDNYPIFFLSRIWARLGFLPAPLRAPYNHSYTEALHLPGLCELLHKYCH
jgi:hypothetical protein